MKRLHSVLICCLAGLSFVQAQSEINAYKYLIVPTRYENFRQTNQYNTSTLTKYHLTRMGYPAVYDNKLPADLRTDPCLGLMLAMVEDSNMFRTRLKFVFTDCEGTAIYETREGESKSKDFAESYKEAIADALGSLQGMDYSYQPPAENVAEAEAVSESREAGQSEGASEAEMQKLSQPDEEMETVAETVVETTRPTASGLLYAQPIANGYQLVDSTPAVRMVLLNSSRPDNFIAMVDGEAKGVVYKEGETWWHEYLQENALVKVALKVKF